MLIRHDLQLVFLHVPKCAGKELRELLSHGAPEGCIQSLFNFAFSAELNRYVDLAHQPLADMRHRPEFNYLAHYTTVACVRSPYERLPSAANEFYRQRSRNDEQAANQQQLSREQRWAYYRQLPRRHAENDPRFVHSQPIQRFTHLGPQPMVDHLLRCETLADDVLTLGQALGWPQWLLDQAQQQLRNAPELNSQLQPEEIGLAHRLYGADFAIFGYERQPEANAGADWPDGWTSLLEDLEPSSHEASQIPLLNQAAQVHWHWGPEAHRPITATPAATRS